MPIDLAQLLAGNEVEYADSLIIASRHDDRLAVEGCDCDAPHRVVMAIDPIHLLAGCEVEDTDRVIKASGKNDRLTVEDCDGHAPDKIICVDLMQLGTRGKLEDTDGL